MSFRIQTGLRDLIQPADKRPTKKAAKVEAGVVSPGVFLLPSPLAPRVIRAIPSGGIVQGQGIDPPHGLTTVPTALLKSDSSRFFKSISNFENGISKGVRIQERSVANVRWIPYLFFL